ncbi:MAG: FadR/GntR family transcriptional regulator [Xanthobacteraceae bacterium]
MKVADVAEPRETEVGEGHAAYTQLQAYLAQPHLVANERLPPERELCDLLGVSRGELRKALAIAEADGQLWRHVGKGTFMGPRPTESVTELVNIAHLTSPAEVMRARVLFEPMICREAAFNANSANIAELKMCIARSREATTWRRYENWDNRFHRSIAESTRNPLLVAMFDMLNTVRRAVVWGRLRTDPQGPDPAHHSFQEHDDIVRAIADRNGERAEKLMRGHLESVTRKIVLF